TARSFTSGSNFFGMNNILSNSKGSGITPGTLHLCTPSSRVLRCEPQRLSEVCKTLGQTQGAKTVSR
ncbi:hypothetical protein, partial [Dermacoccus nishinomiyaensis]